MDNVLNEYLVSLGFRTDTVQFARFAHALRDASMLVDLNFLSMAKKVIGFQVAITGAFAAAGVAALGIADKTAMADQQYRLLALHMYTTLPVARELKIAMDALGQPLENIMWDPELARRFSQLVKDQRTMTEELGPNFEAQMYKIRDVRFEFSRLGVEMQYLTMKVVEDLAEAFGTNIDGLLAKMRNFNAWFISHMPEIAQWVATNLKPALLDIKMVMSETWQVIKAIASAFTHLVGSLSGNTALESTTLSFKNFMTAIQTSLGWLTKFVISVDRGIEILAHLASALADLNSLNFKGAGAELSAAKSLLTVGSGATAGGAVGGTIGTVIGAFGGPVGAMAGGTVGMGIGAGVGALLGIKNTPEREKIKQSIVAAAKAIGIPPELALAVAGVESGFRQYDEHGHLLMSHKPGSHATGIFQLEPATARELGVDPSIGIMNIVGGVKYLSQLLQKYHGNQFLALQHYYGSTDVAQNEAYARRVMAAENQLTVNVDVKVDADGIAHKSVKVMRKTQANRTQRNLAEFQGWGYTGSW